LICEGVFSFPASLRIHDGGRAVVQKKEANLPQTTHFQIQFGL
jgi:hypothetical protein